MNIKIDGEFKDLIPPPSAVELEGLEADIVRAGRALVPLMLWGNTLIDGHNRYGICTRLGLPFETMDVGEADWTRTDVRIWIRRNQLHRRNLDSLTRCELALGLEGDLREKGLAAKRAAGEAFGRGQEKVVPISAQAIASPGLEPEPTPKPPKRVDTTRKQVADHAGVSQDTLDKARVVIERSTPEAQAAIKAGTSTINKEYKAIVGAERKAAQVEAVKHAALPVGQYSVIVADPPWRYGARAEDVTHRAANPYPSMDTEAICALGIADMAAEDAILWLWTTNAHMLGAYFVAEAWGFTVKTILTWAKDRMGTGDWLRGQTEHCLMCVRGKPTVTLTNQTTLLHGPMREHSRKPDEFYTMVETLCPSPDGGRVELFCRQARPGWIAAGAEVAKFKAAS